jgi:type IV pilus assembly protein PilX
MPARRDRGIALVVGMVLLVLLALLGSTAYSLATQEERMAGNARDHERAFEAAELALRECERLALGSPSFDSTNGMYTAPTAPVQVGASATRLLWYGDAGVADFASLTTPVIAQAANSLWSQSPRCIAESFDPHLPGRIGLSANAGSPHVARVTAVGFGLNATTTVKLVSYVAY